MTKKQIVEEIIEKYVRPVTRKGLEMTAKVFTEQFGEIPGYRDFYRATEDETVSFAKEVYENTYTLEEITELAKFMGSPLGHKYLTESQRLLDVDVVKSLTAKVINRPDMLNNEIAIATREQLLRTLVEDEGMDPQDALTYVTRHGNHLCS